jgi:hypothetical protein
VLPLRGPEGPLFHLTRHLVVPGYFHPSRRLRDWIGHVEDNVNFFTASTRSLRPTRAQVKERARLTAVGMTKRKKLPSCREMASCN